MKISELRGFPEEELQEKLDDALDELANLRIQKATHQLVNPSRIKIVKKDIARIKTLLREYQRGISKPRLETE
ncbi:50S ribosomal protein L29 [Candidatus Saccharibacteria bacterium]|nr:50S ribosomal protein L29 [Candidatus Saccharibacteria bacterium]NIV03725.1 50S ribosomal protein L29 [Calditrichia bacterium]NIV72026.1 50S ribosomal protein L29 [Calditrichia bacterium]NIV98859.1 50S ribosomal protein L29 [Candidatus Saccharibacteria bacterium]NIW79136.1 50S ribosomal protein L29 [Calditrichia bacterium]